MIKSKIIALEDVSKTFDTNTAREVRAIDGVSLDFFENEWVTIIGGNGSGKSTLLRLVAQEILPDAGGINLANNGQRIVFIEQNSGDNLVPTMTVYENLALAKQQGLRNIPTFRRYRQAEQFEEFAKIVSQFNLGLENRLNDQVAFLSGGQQQAIVAAQVLLSQGKLILLDEFTSALDRKTAPVILNFLRNYAEKHGALVVEVTHDFSWIESTSDRVIILETGKVKKELSTKDHKLSAQSLMELAYGR